MKDHLAVFRLNNGQFYNITASNLAFIRAHAEAATDKFTHDRGMNYWDERSADFYCKNLEENVQKLGVRYA